MARESFQRELNSLVGEVLELGRDVESCLDTMAYAMENWDAEMVRQEIGIDSRYKEWGTQIDDGCLILQARQAPVARDLRLMHSVHVVTNHLVRAGTLCEHICQGIVNTTGYERDPELAATLFEMAKEARSLFRQGLDVFEDREIDRARDLEAADDKVDLLYSEAMNLVVNPTKAGSGSPEWRVWAALATHYLERVADHGVDISACTVFLVTGEHMESAMRQYRDRKLGQDEE